MTAERRNFPQFFITAPSACPYIPGQKERKVFTHLVGNDAKQLSTQLIHSGFRRSQNIAYRPACDACNACVSVRVPVESFDWSRSFRKVIKANADLVPSLAQPVATSEHYDLFRAYIDTRHSDGGMADMSVIDFASMIDETVVDTRLVEYRFPKGHEDAGQLAACVLMDVLMDGLSLIYSFYDPGLPQRSLGSFIILDCIQRAKRLNLPYVYLGYFVPGSTKMAYKARFKPQERLDRTGWVLHN
ncbi:arginyltransferase [Aestuariivirga litoralis]|uniref:arginyltransferase n=1 Tax=Aestuariivirga litoralis TaxID=2650924 RepID=UPI0018C5791B|nr:arginyltransferase [Aestuariivirga litoralis]MBG1231826.1 arginyltransferase [Aestuariivirga litoralis]